MRFAALCFCLFVFFAPHAGRAYPWLGSDRLELDSQILNEEDAKNRGALEFDLHGSYFPTKETSRKTSLFFGAASRYQSPAANADLGFQYSFGEKLIYFRLSELNVVFPLFPAAYSGRLKMTMGFSQRNWSETDEYWNLGLWQPRYRADPFRPKTAGLPGIYFDFSGDISFTALFSYIYLPDIIIYPQIFDGAVGSKNPFFSASFDTSFSELNWQIKKRPELRLTRLLKPLAAFQIRHKVLSSHLSLSYAFKPANQLQYVIGFKGINLSKGDGKITITDIDYDVIPHHLLTLEGKLALNNDISLTGSLFYEKPGKPPNRPKNWITDNFESHLTAGFFAKIWGAAPSREEKTLFSFGYTKTFENKKRESLSNVIIEDMESFFGRSFEWKNAFSSSMEYTSARLLKGFQLQLRLNYALDNQIYAAIFESHLHLTPSWRIYLSGDVVFRLSSSSIKKGSSSISNYKDLSRLLAGGKYVF